MLFIINWFKMNRFIKESAKYGIKIVRVKGEYYVIDTCDRCGQKYTYKISNKSHKCLEPFQFYCASCIKETGEWI